MKLFKWLKQNAAILILSLSIMLHAFAVIHSNVQADNYIQKVQVVNPTYAPVPVKITK